MSAVAMSLRRANRGPWASCYSDGHSSLIKMAIMPIYQQAHMKRVLIKEATSQGSDEPAHKHIFARAFAVRRHVVETLRKLQAKNACL